MYAPGAGAAPLYGARSADLTIGVLLAQLNRTLAVDATNYRVTVEAGMTVRALLAEATRLGMSVPLGSVPAFADLMLGGVLLTGAHGSAFRGRGSLADIVRSITWVDASGSVRRAARHSKEGRAIAGGLGLLGIVTELELQLGPPTHTLFETVWKRADGDLATDIRRMLDETPNMLVVWRPDLGRYNAVRLREVPTFVPNTGASTTIELPKPLAMAMGGTLRAWEELARPPWPLEEALCYVAKESSISHGWAASATSGRVALGGVGPTNEMQSVSCGDECAWQEDVANLAMWDTHFLVGIDQLPQWMDDVKAVLDKDFWRPKEPRRGRCLPPGYFWLRFGGGTDDYLSPATGAPNGTVALQLSFLTARATAPRWGIKHGHVLEVLEQLTLCKYKGKPVSVDRWWW
jgi:hypothetical protein